MLRSEVSFVQVTDTTCLLRKAANRTTRMFPPAADSGVAAVDHEVARRRRSLSKWEILVQPGRNLCENCVLGEVRSFHLGEQQDNREEDVTAFGLIKIPILSARMLAGPARPRRLRFPLRIYSMNTRSLAHDSSLYLNSMRKHGIPRRVDVHVGGLALVAAEREGHVVRHDAHLRGEPAGAQGAQHRGCA